MNMAWAFYIRYGGGGSFRSGLASIATSINDILASFEHLSPCNLLDKGLTCFCPHEFDVVVEKIGRHFDQLVVNTWQPT